MLERKIMVFLLMFAILVVVRYVLNIIKGFRTNTTIERTWKDDVLLGTALSYILTIIFTGFTLF